MRRSSIDTVRLKAFLQALSEVETMLSGLMREYRGKDGQILEMDQGAYEALDRARERVRTKATLAERRLR